MRRIIILGLLLVLSTIILTTNYTKAATLQKMGGFVDSITVGNEKIFKCGKNPNLICWTESDDGRGKQPGDPWHGFFHDPGNPNIGIGYINAEYVSELPGDALNGPEIRFRIVQSTTIYYSYSAWYANLPN
jgi:hypothetical protein